MSSFIPALYGNRYMTKELNVIYKDKVSKEPSNSLIIVLFEQGVDVAHCSVEHGRLTSFLERCENYNDYDIAWVYESQDYYTQVPKGDWIIDRNSNTYKLFAEYKEHIRLSRTSSKRKRVSSAALTDKEAAKREKRKQRRLARKARLANA